jgi:uncharacterized BrkB/YihY/UPF0761 family membrane protein
MAMRGGERSEPSDGTDIDLDQARESRLQRGKHLVLDVAEVGDSSDRFLGRRPRLARAVVLAAAVVRQQGAEQVSLVASGAAFWLVISALPAAIAVVALFGIVVNPEQVANHLGSLADAAPASLGSLLGGQLQRVAMTDRTGLTIGLLVSVPFAVWTASAGVYNLDRAIRDVYGLPRQRYVDARARAFAGAFVLVVALGAIALTTAAALAHTPGALAVALGAPAVFVGIVAAVTGLYRFAVGQPMRRASFYRERWPRRSA